MSGGLGPGQVQVRRRTGGIHRHPAEPALVLLLFSVIVAVLGIISTLALSVFERTREIGLLRAVGLRRRQPSGMITIESIATIASAVVGVLAAILPAIRAVRLDPLQAIASGQ